MTDMAGMALGELLAECAILRDRVAQEERENQRLSNELAQATARADKQEQPAGLPLPPPVSDADVIVAIRSVIWDAMRGREIGGDRTLVGMVKRIITERDEAMENRRGEYEHRCAAEARATSAEAREQAAEKRIADLCDAHEEQFLRATSAEAARDRFKEYAQHKPKCAAIQPNVYKVGARIVDDDGASAVERTLVSGPGPCDCGLASLLTGEAPTPQGEKQE